MNQTSEQRRRSSAPYRQSGSVLVLVLILLTLMSALVLHSQHAARLTRQTEERALAQTRLRAALLDEAARALQRLADDPDPLVDHLKSEWAEVLDSERPDGLSTLATIEDMNRRFDLNNVTPGTGFAYRDEGARILMDLMTFAGDFSPVARVDALQHWTSEEVAVSPASEVYRRQTLPYEAPKTWLQSWSELLWVDGFDAAYVLRNDPYRATQTFHAPFLDLVTLIPGPRDGVHPVNINTASRITLEGLLGINREPLIRYILMTREDRPFRSIDGLLAQADPASLEEVRSYLDVRSRHFQIDIRAVDEQRRDATLRIIAHRDDEGAVRILRWMM